MPAIAFDTLKFANKLKDAGVPDKQAEVQAASFGEMLEVNLKDLATKDDIRELREEMRGQRESTKEGFREIKTLIAEISERLTAQIDHKTQDIRHELKQVETRLDARITQSETKLNGEIYHLKWLIGSCVGLVLAACMRLFFFRAP